MTQPTASAGDSNCFPSGVKPTAFDWSTAEERVKWKATSLALAKEKLHEAAKNWHIAGDSAQEERVRAQEKNLPPNVFNDYGDEIVQPAPFDPDAYLAKHGVVPYTNTIPTGSRPATPQPTQSPR